MCSVGCAASFSPLCSGCRCACAHMYVCTYVHTCVPPCQPRCFSTPLFSPSSPSPSHQINSIQNQHPLRQPRGATHLLYMYVCMYIRAHTCVRLHMHTCVAALSRGCARVCVCVQVCVCVCVWGVCVTARCGRCAFYSPHLSLSRPLFNCSCGCVCVCGAPRGTPSRNKPRAHILTAGGYYAVGCCRTHEQRPPCC